jgi:hypothetical protein
MKKLLQSVLDFLLFSNIFMSLCAVAQALVTFHLIGSKPVLPVLGLLLFTSTLGIYNFCILITRPKSLKHPPTNGYVGFFRITGSWLRLPLFRYCRWSRCFLSSQPNQKSCLFLGILSFAYGLPLFAVGEHKFGLRNIPGLKPFLLPWFGQ